MFNILPISQTGFHWHLIMLNLICELSVGSPPPYFLHLQDKGLISLNHPQLNTSYKCNSCKQNIHSLKTPPATVPDEKNNLTDLGF